MKYYELCRDIAEVSNQINSLNQTIRWSVETFDTTVELRILEGELRELKLQRDFIKQLFQEENDLFDKRAPQKSQTHSNQGASE